MRVAYDLTLPDVVKFQISQIHADTATRRKLRIMVWGGAALVIAVLSIVGLSVGSWSYGVLAIIVAATYTLIMPKLLRFSIQRAAVKFYASEQGRALLGPRELEITKGGLVVRARSKETLVPWSQIGRVWRAPDYLYIYTGPRAAHIVPERHLTKGDFAAFYQRLRKHAGAPDRE